MHKTTTNYLQDGILTEVTHTAFTPDPVLDCVVYDGDEMPTRIFVGRVGRKWLLATDYGCTGRAALASPGVFVSRERAASHYARLTGQLDFTAQSSHFTKLA